MPVPSAITDLSAVAASNSPSGSEAPTEGDNHLRTAYAFIKQLYDGVSGVAYPTLAQLASTASASDGAVMVGLHDAAGHYTATTVEAAFAEIGTAGGNQWDFDTAYAAFDSSGKGPIGRRAKHIARHLEEFGALPSASGSTNATAIEAAFAWLHANGGGKLIGERNGVYAVSSALNLKRSSTTGKGDMVHWDGQGCKFDFSASGLTSGNLVAFGSTGSGYQNSSERMWSLYENFSIIGPEDADDIIPESKYRDTNLGGGVASSTTTIQGFVLDQALRTKVSNVRVERCYKACNYIDSFYVLLENIDATKCIIGHHENTGCTYLTAINCKSEFCTFPLLIRPDNIQTAIANTTFIGFLAENCTVGPHLDQRNTADGANMEMQNLTFINTYLENIYRDHWRVGIAFDAAPANASTRGADRTAYIGSLNVLDGRSTGDGVGGAAGYAAARKAFYFGSNSKCASGSINWPCETGDITNLPAGMQFRGALRAEDSTTQNIQTVEIGQGFAHVGSGGTLLYTDGGLISASSTPGTGLYDVTLKKALTSADNASIVVTARQASLYAAVDDTNTTTTNVRVQMRSDAGTLTNGKFCIHVKGEMAAF